MVTATNPESSNGKLALRAMREVFTNRGAQLPADRAAVDREARAVLQNLTALQLVEAMITGESFALASLLPSAGQERGR